MSYSIWLCRKWIIFFITSQTFRFWNKVCEKSEKCLCLNMYYPRLIFSGIQITFNTNFIYTEASKTHWNQTGVAIYNKEYIIIIKTIGCWHWSDHLHRRQFRVMELYFHPESSSEQSYWSCSNVDSGRRIKLQSIQDEPNLLFSRQAWTTPLIGNTDNPKI